MQVNIYEAQTRLCELVEQARRGETVIIARSGTPQAKLVALDAGPKREIKFGLMKDELGITPDFDDPLADDLLDLFENGSIKPPPDLAR